MNTLTIEGEAKGAEVVLDKSSETILFGGRFLPQNTKEFFEPILQWFEEYVQNPNKNTIIQFKIDYFNTSSSKKFLDLFLMFESIHGKQTNVEVQWYYVEDDVDILEAGKGYEELVELPFNFLTYTK